MYDDPSVDDFKGYFVRDFPYAPPDTDDLNFVIDADIQRAIDDTSAMINPDFAADQDGYTRQFLLLAAHNLVMNLRASSQGISGQFAWLQTSKGAGGVSEGITIPQRILDNPELAMLTKTNYGAKYLFMVLPQMIGNVFTVCGRTKA